MSAQSLLGIRELDKTIGIDYNTIVWFNIIILHRPFVIIGPSLDHFYIVTVHICCQVRDIWNWFCLSKNCSNWTWLTFN